MSVRLVIDSESFRRSQQGTIFASIWFQIEADYFPGPGWSDLAPGFVCAWVEALHHLVSGASRNESVGFMDGPYSIEASALESGRLKLEFLHNQAGQNVLVITAFAKSREILENAILVAEQVLDAYHKMNWTDLDESAIRTSLPYAKKLLSSV